MGGHPQTPLQEGVEGVQGLLYDITLSPLTHSTVIHLPIGGGGGGGGGAAPPLAAGGAGGGPDLPGGGGGGTPRSLGGGGRKTTPTPSFPVGRWRRSTRSLL